MWEFFASLGAVVAGVVVVCCSSSITTLAGISVLAVKTVGAIMGLAGAAKLLDDNRSLRSVSVNSKKEAVATNWRELTRDENIVNSKRQVEKASELARLAFRATLSFHLSKVEEILSSRIADTIAGDGTKEEPSKVEEIEAEGLRFIALKLYLVSAFQEDLNLVDAGGEAEASFVLDNQGKLYFRNKAGAFIKEGQDNPITIDIVQGDRCGLPHCSENQVRLVERRQARGFFEKNLAAILTRLSKYQRVLEDADDLTAQNISDLIPRGPRESSLFEELSKKRITFFNYLETVCSNYFFDIALEKKNLPQSLQPGVIHVFRYFDKPNKEYLWYYDLLLPSGKIKHGRLETQKVLSNLNGSVNRYSERLSLKDRIRTFVSKRIHLEDLESWFVRIAQDKKDLPGIEKNFIHVFCGANSEWQILSPGNLIEGLKGSQLINELDKTKKEFEKDSYIKELLLGEIDPANHVVNDYRTPHPVATAPSV